MDSKLIEVYAVEEIDIDRSYNKKGKKRQTHLEIIGGWVSYALRSGHRPEILEVIICKSET